MSFFSGNSNPSQLQHRSPVARPGPIPDVRIDALLQPAAVKRAASSTGGGIPAASHSCGPNETTGICQRYVGASTETLPIVLGVVIPLVGAFLVLIYLHRRHVKKLRKEDADDAHKSLDFGTGGIPHHLRTKKGKGNGIKDAPEMSVNDAKASVRRDRGLSMDMDVTNPYLLPPGLQQSRESLHSLSRNLDNGDDKYQRTTFIPNDGSMSYPSSIRSPHDDSSSFTGSSRRRFEGDQTQDLLRNAQTISRSRTPQSRDQSVASNARKPLAPPKISGLAPGNIDTARASTVSTVSISGPPPPVPEKENSPKLLDKAIMRNDASKIKSVPKSYNATATLEVPASKMAASNNRVVIPEQLSVSREPHIPSINLQLPDVDLHDSQHGQGQQSQYSQDPHFPHREEHQSEQMQYSDYPERGETQQPKAEAFDYYDDDEQDYYSYLDYADELGYDPQQLVMMGERPLPPDDPTESKEQRAIRIRSFYKEYFDESNNSRPQMPSHQDYYDGSENYTYDGYDVSGYYEDSHQPSNGSARFHGAGRRHRMSYSDSGFLPGPRSFSSASGRYGPQGRRGPMQKQLPPPKALNILPTPHLLKDDLYLPTDFAPPSSVRGQRSGTPDSLRGGQRPFSPARRHVPLVSAFDDLAVMPSPHALRKSSTFTALDFAPPPRIKADGSGSDNGSIRSGRSNRSNISAAQLHSIRTGAYRVSRIPKEVAGTRNELASSLRPQWDMSR